MSAARRFLRYVLPGISTMLLFSVYLYLSHPLKVQEVLKDSAHESGLGAVVALFLASGALGYMLSAMHHFLCNCGFLVWETLGLVVNVAPAIKRAVSDVDPLTSRVEVRAIDLAKPDNAYDGESVTRQDAWVLLNMIWHTHRGRYDDGTWASAEARMKSLWDLYHSAGALLMGSISAFVAWVVSWSRLDSPRESWLGDRVAFAGGLALILILCGNMKQLASRVTSFSADAVLELLRRRKKAGDQRIVLHFSW